jgi:hypothetical protein
MHALVVAMMTLKALLGSEKAPESSIQQLLNESERSGQIRYCPDLEWHWMNDQPSHLTPIRVHGGVSP